MAAGISLTSYTDFEEIMNRLSEERGWEFEFAGKPVPPQSVFNQSVYAPALLAAASAELAAREIPGDLGIDVIGESNSFFGAKVCFPEDRSSIFSQLLRISTASLIIESLPKVGNTIQLDPLQFVLGDHFAQYVGHGQEANL